MRGMFAGLALVCALGSVCRAAMVVEPVPVRPAGEIALFNGRDLAGWTMVLKDDGAVVSNATWQVVDGEIRCSGSPLGYLATQQSYADYTLRLEWRWTGKAVNSGVFVLKSGPDDQFLPRAIEVQLKKGRAGDIVLLNQATANGLENPGIRVIAREGETVELSEGEWNRLEITVKDRRVTVTVNGVLQNNIQDAYAAAGQICLQSEGGAIAFRDLTLVPAP